MTALLCLNVPSGPEAFDLSWFDLRSCRRSWNRLVCSSRWSEPRRSSAPEPAWCWAPERRQTGSVPCFWWQRDVWGLCYARPLLENWLNGRHHGPASLKNIQPAALSVHIRAKQRIRMISVRFRRKQKILRGGVYTTAEPDLKETETYTKN